MYKGSAIIPIRIVHELLTRLDGTIKRVNATREAEPFDRSSFIRKAIEEKIAHYERSRAKKKGK